eukprot:m.40229 g.40229  ORF g.40229 m.40229 type:complete len:311 (-) comp5938_c0_seq1:294-1226(-)
MAAVAVKVGTTAGLKVPLPPTGDIKIPMGQKLMVGAVAGVLGTSAIFPIDAVKTRLQAQAPDPLTGKLRYSGVGNCFRSILTTEGAGSFYKGLGANLIGVTPEKAIKLAANDFFREKLTDPVTGELPISRQVIAGGLAGFLQVSATNPMEIVKLRVQLQNMYKPPELRLTTMQVVQDLGFRGLYKGVLATWMRDVPYSIIFFPSYSIMKEKLSDENGHAGIPQILLAGAVAGASAAWACTPADTIKTRLQAEGSPYTGIRDCYTRTVQNEGYTALFKGAVPRMSVTAPLFGIALLAFEMQKRYLMGEKLF